MIVSVGLSHREAPIEVRERLALDREAVAAFLKSLVTETKVREAVCLSTCNRMEVYATASCEDSVVEAAFAVAQALERVAGSASISRFLKTRRTSEAILHLFRVASSLDSLVVGEPQVLGQVKEALDLARAAGTIGGPLERAWSRALHVAKRVRTETAIGAGQVSVSSVAVDLARQIFGDLRGHSALLLGAGEMAEAAARLLVKSGTKLVVVNRSPERANALAESLGAHAREWDAIVSSLVDADVLLASTGARDFVVTHAMVAQAMRKRRGRSLLVVDIAVPRNIEPSVNELANVYLYDVDALARTVAESMSGRRAEADRAEDIVRTESETFEARTQVQWLGKTIGELRGKVRGVLASELDKSLSGRLRHLSIEDRQALDAMADAVTKKLLHGPLTRIKALAAEPRGEELVQALHELFDLREPPEGSSRSSDEASGSEPRPASSDGILAAETPLALASGTGKPRSG